MRTLTPPAPDVEALEHEAPAAGRITATSRTTAAGTLLVAAWVGYVLYGVWLEAAGPEHPVPPAWLDAALSMLGYAVLAVAGGLLFRRRWALWGSVALALPMCALAVMCFQAEVGNHWIAEAAFAGAIVAGSVHPASWRMHTR